MVLGNFNDSGVILKYFKVIFKAIIIFSICIFWVYMGTLKVAIPLYVDFQKLSLCVSHYSICSSSVNFNIYIFINVLVLVFRVLVLVTSVFGIWQFILINYQNETDFNIIVNKKLSSTGLQEKLELIVNKLTMYFLLISLIIFLYYFILIG